MKKFLKKILDIRRIIKRKNAQLRAEREKLMAAETANKIYASYILCLAAGEGEVRISKAEIAETVGKYRAEISSTEDEYVIRVKETGSAEQKTFAKGTASDRREGADNGAAPSSAGGEGIEKA